MVIDGPPYPKGHDPNARCDYHSGSAGHSTEQCKRLKESVQKLINDGKICFPKNAQPNVGQNPLPNHDGENMNIIEGGAHAKGSVDTNRTGTINVHSMAVGTELDNYAFVQNTHNSYY